MARFVLVGMFAVGLLAVCGWLADAQSPGPAQWRSPRKGAPVIPLRTADATAAPGTTAANEARPLTPADVLTPRSASPAGAPADASAPPSPPRLRVSNAGQLAGDRGQVWREYDLRPYTSKITTTEKPQQAIIDWILRDTGTDAWFSDAMSVLHADRDTLRVYHTPQVQQQVADIVERFIASEAETHALGLRLVTVSSPNWRAKAHSLLRPVSVQSPGVEAWLLRKENAAQLLSELRARADFRELNAPSVAVQNGQSQTVAQTKLRHYIRGLRLRETYPFYETEAGQIDEGYSLQVSPLLAADRRTLDIVLKCHIDQLEKLVPVGMDVPAVGATPAQRVQIQVPQVVSWRLHERFRWPADHVLLLSCGVVASPTPEKEAPLAIPGLPVLAGGPGRADALLFIESHGKLNAVLSEPPPAPPVTGAAVGTRGRY